MRKVRVVETRICRRRGGFGLADEGVLIRFWVRVDAGLVVWSGGLLGVGKCWGFGGRKFCVIGCWVGMIGKRLLSIAVKGTGFAIVLTRHVPHMFCDLGQ